MKKSWGDSPIGGSFLVLLVETRNIMAISDYIEDLIYRILSGEADGEDRTAFREWLEESEEHRRFFREVERAWYTGKYAMRWRNVKASEAWRKVEHRHERRRWRRIGFVGGSVAAAVALLVGVALLWLPEREKPVVVAKSVIKPGESKAVLIIPGQAEISLSDKGRDTIREEGVDILNVGAQVDYSRQGGEVDEVKWHELVVPKGGEYRICLPDCTMVYMNADSRLRFPVRFIGEMREVELEGEAYFEVTADKWHPFVVRTTEVAVRVLGTGFNVMAYEGDARTEVTLVEGAVNVRGGRTSETLRPSEQLVWENVTGEHEVRTVDVRKYVDWKAGILNFDAMPLDELADKLSRWYNVEFFFSSEDLKRLRFSGAVRKYNEIDYILKLIEATTDVSFNISGTTVVVNKR